MSLGGMVQPRLVLAEPQTLEQHLQSNFGIVQTSHLLDKDQSTKEDSELLRAQQRDEIERRGT